MSVGGDSDSGEMTLAFSLSAVKQLADPAAAFDDAHHWSRYVGIVDNHSDAVASIASEYDLQQDFDLDGRDKWLALEEIRATTQTPRHVYVGATTEDQRVATHLGWEYVPVTTAADKAGWTLSGAESDTGLVARLRNILPI